MARNERVGVALFRAGYLTLLGLLLLPLVIVISTSVMESTYLTFPPENLSFRWYIEFARDRAWISAIVNSVVIGVGTTVLSTSLGVAAALGVREYDSRLTDVLLPVSILPLFVPPVIIGVALLTLLSAFGLQQTYLGVIVAHSLWATPLVFFIMQAVFSRFDWALRDAALNLGATPARAFFEIVVPEIKEGLLAAAVIAFIVSLQEFVMALFLTGHQTRTVPVLAYSAIRQVLDPVVSVASTLLILSVLVVLTIATLALSIERLARHL